MPPIFGWYVAVASARTSVSVTTPAERFHAVPSIPRMVRCIVLVLWWRREVKMLWLDRLRGSGGMNMRERWHVPEVSLFLDHECADVAAVLALVLASGF